MFLSFANLMFSQDSKIDTISHHNGSFSIQEIDYQKGVISVFNYDTNAVILLEENYTIVDSIECYQCNDIPVNGKMVSPRYIYSTNYSFIDTSLNKVVKSGDWKYYKNGVLDYVVNYLPLAYETDYVYCDEPYESILVQPCGAGANVEFIIDKITYYDSEAIVRKVEKYQNGILKTVWNYKSE